MNLMNQHLPLANCFSRSILFQEATFLEFLNQGDMPTGKQSNEKRECIRNMELTHLALKENDVESLDISSCPIDLFKLSSP